MIHHINNTRDFVNKVSGLTIAEGEIITSYDVSALFTAIPPDDAIKIARKCLEKDGDLPKRTPLQVNDIIEMLDLCLKTTYFSYKGQFFVQKHDMPWAPLSPRYWWTSTWRTSSI